jgi:uncharacterized membrane protein YhdT
MLEAGKVDAIDEAAKLAPTLPDPPPESAADHRARRSLRILLGFTAIWCVMAVSAALASGGPVGFVIIVGMTCLILYLLVPQIQRLRAALRAPFVREAVVIVERRQEGRNRADYVAVVANRDDERRELELLADAGQVRVGDVGVAFSRANMLWHFHRIT